MALLLHDLLQTAGPETLDGEGFMKTLGSGIIAIAKLAPIL
ncbi:hypothetical protein [Nodosilinea sp. LEGE 07088]|nr:hypothetical protein [Nodosilinea sp. LEGE 07088]